MFQNLQTSANSFLADERVVQVKNKVSKHFRDIYYPPDILFHLIDAGLQIRHKEKDFAQLVLNAAKITSGIILFIPGIICWALQKLVINPLKVASDLKSLEDTKKFYSETYWEVQQKKFQDARQEGGAVAVTTLALQQGWGVIKDIFDDCSNTGFLAGALKLALFFHPTALAIAAASIALFTVIRNLLPSKTQLEQKQSVNPSPETKTDSKTIFFWKAASFLVETVQGKHYHELEEDLDKWKKKNPKPTPIKAESSKQKIAGQTNSFNWRGFTTTIKSLFILATTMTLFKQPEVESKKQCDEKCALPWFNTRQKSNPQPVTQLATAV